MLSPGLTSYQRSMRTASCQPSSFRLPSITIEPWARVMAYVSPRVDVCAEADGGIPAIAAVTAAALTMRRAGRGRSSRKQQIAWRSCGQDNRELAQSDFTMSDVSGIGRDFGSQQS